MDIQSEILMMHCSSLKCTTTTAKTSRIRIIHRSNHWTTCML